MQAKDVIALIEKVAPLSQQESWDNSGLQIGQRDTEVTSALLCTDVSEQIVDEAIAKGCEMIISHHPLLFHGMKRIEGVNSQQRCVIKAIRAGLVIYSAHTSMDTYLHGVSGHMAQKLGITDYELLQPTGENVGLGVVGYLPEPMSLSEFLQLLSVTFEAKALRYVCRTDENETVSKIALCGGAGSEFVDEAIRQSADVYVSADFKYHEFLNADGRINIADIGHFESEHFTKEIFGSLLRGKVRCVAAQNDVNKVKVFVGRSEQ